MEIDPCPIPIRVYYLCIGPDQMFESAPLNLVIVPMYYLALCVLLLCARGTALALYTKNLCRHFIFIRKIAVRNCATFIKDAILTCSSAYILDIERWKPSAAP